MSEIISAAWKDTRGEWHSLPVTRPTAQKGAQGNAKTNPGKLSRLSTSSLGTQSPQTTDEHTRPLMSPGETFN